MNKKIKKILKKKNKSKIVSLTAYSKSIGKILDKFLILFWLVTQWQMFYMVIKILTKLSLENIIQHTISVKMGIKKSLLVVDMPKGSYKNIKSAKKNAKKVIIKKQNVMQLK